MTKEEIIRLSRKVNAALENMERQGKQIAFEQGVTYSVFKARALTVVQNAKDEQPEETWILLFSDYCAELVIQGEYISPEKFADEYFSEYKDTLLSLQNPNFTPIQAA